ncbi:MAG: flagellar basal body-associated FliL family protein [Gemmatales bacterium]|nr:flagellar basal body-associated FliL family protein [Gemmatales bacterium]MCS7160556.1 flagellar basal body-associated FliL family protein [Gemmatales bacterium]MDW8175757.1 flagellar basal body-associated FliL family protein [Gemmatales bacterium]MDW8222291.1 flagellar basal body-associated FliL family protein [Gemmatales bacterium]
MAQTTQEQAAANSSGRWGWLVLGGVALASIAGGFALPWLLSGTTSSHGHSHEAPHQTPKNHAKDEKTAFVPFGDVVVNLHEERLTRYLRLKIVLEVEETEEKHLQELLNKRKAPLKSWLISYLADRTLDEVRGTLGMNRIRREIRDHFNEMLYPDGREVIRQVHFEEFTVQ